MIEFQKCCGWMFVFESREINRCCVEELKVADYYQIVYDDGSLTLLLRAIALSKREVQVRGALIYKLEIQLRNRE